MTTNLPDHVVKQLQELIAERLPVDQIAFMMRLDPQVVEAEIARLNTTATTEERTA